MAEGAEGCGGKAHNLGRMIGLGLPVPPGFVVMDRAFQEFLDYNGLREPIAAICADLDVECPRTLRTAAQAIRERVIRAKIPRATRESIDGLIFETLRDAPLIVRSSAVGEDSDQAAFAGQLDSFLNVDPGQASTESLLACWASYWSARSLFYQRSRGVALRGMGVVVQELVQSRISGVLFTENPDPSSGGADMLVAEYCYGHGVISAGGDLRNPSKHAIRTPVI